MVAVVISKNSTGPFASTGPDGFSETKLRGLNPTTNYSTDTTFATTSWDKSAGDVETTVFKVDFTGVPTGTVTDGEIGFYLDNGNNVDSSGVSLFELLVDFTLNQTTFDARKTSPSLVNWTVGGARGSGTDREALPFVTEPRPAISGDWIAFTGSSVNAQISDWLNAIVANNGFLAELQNHDVDPFFTYQTYISSEGTDGFRPYVKFNVSPSGSNASANQTLQPVTQATSGTTPHAANASQSLKPVTQATSAGPRASGNASQSLTGVTQNASGSVPFGASANQTLQPVTQATSGTTPHAGQANQTLPGVTQTASGTVGDSRNGQASQTLQPVTQTSAGAAVAGAQATQTLRPVTQATSGTTPHAANASQTLGPVTQLASGTVGDTRNGNASQTLQPVTQTASGTVAANAQADQTLRPVTQATSGEAIGGTDGSASQTLQPVTQNASGTVAANAAAVQFLQAVRQLARAETGTGNRVINNPITVYVQPDALISVYNNDGFIVEI